MSTCYFSLFTIVWEQLFYRLENRDPVLGLWTLHYLCADAAKLYLEALATFHKFNLCRITYLVFSSNMASPKKDNFAILEQYHMSATGQDELTSYSYLFFPVLLSEFSSSMLTTLIQKALNVKFILLSLLALSLCRILSFVWRFIRIWMHGKEIHCARKLHRPLFYSLPIYIWEVWVLFDLTISIEGVLWLHSYSVLWQII